MHNALAVGLVSAGPHVFSVEFGGEEAGAEGDGGAEGDAGDAGGDTGRDFGGGDFGGGDVRCTETAPPVAPAVHPLFAANGEPG